MSTRVKPNIDVKIRRPSAPNAYQVKKSPVYSRQPSSGLSPSKLQILGANLGWKSSTGNLTNGRSPNYLPKIGLARAAREGLLDVVQSTLSLDTSSINDVDEEGYAATHHAARYNRIAVLKCLVEAGADINVKGTDEVTPLHLACRYNSSSTVQYLLSQGADVNAKDCKGKTPLHYTTRKGHELSTKMLLSVSGCNVNAFDHDQTSPLHMAAIQGNINVIELLISRGADIFAVDINELTALMWAATEGHVTVAARLLKAAMKHGIKGAKYIQLQDNEGNTALHLAVQNGSTDVCELLLNQCADSNAQKLSKDMDSNFYSNCSNS